MNKTIIKLLVLLSIVCMSCQPRIDMDMKQWGDHAYIDNVEIINLDTDSFKLAEFYQSQTPLEVTGVRNIVVSVGTAQIDSTSFTATVKVKPTAKLDYAGIRIYHKGVKVEPINKTPRAGIVADLTEKSFTYRLISADGTKHDWTINIEQ